VGLLILVGCAGTSRENESRFRDNITTGNYEVSKKMIKDGEYYKGDNSRLLHYAELGLLSHLQGNYYQSLLYFDKAHKLSKDLYTKSIKKKIASYLVNDSEDNYYGELYERSFIRFYQALNHILIAQQGFYESYNNNLFDFGNKKENQDDTTVVKVIPRKELAFKEVRSHFQGARAAIVEWDSFLSRFKNNTLGLDQYKNDLTQKTFGAYVHSKMATRSELNIAKSLLKDSSKVLFRNYNIYPSFNIKNKMFRKNYKNLPKLKTKVIKNKYVESTAKANKLISYINNKIKNIKKKIKGKRKVTFILRDGSISKKIVKKYDIPIGFNTLTYRTVKKGDFVSFVRKVLAVSAGGLPTISFELPSFVNASSARSFNLIIKDLDGKVVQEKTMALINPLSELANEALSKRISFIKKKVGARLVTKHLAALMTSYVTYKSMLKKGQSLMALTISSASYYLANRAIAASERADLRSWVSLPNSIQTEDIALSPGQYQVILRDNFTKIDRNLKKLVVTKKTNNLLYTERIF
jgi:hypothetical protein